jgi:hypothetical protein
LLSESPMAEESEWILRNNRCYGVGNMESYFSTPVSLSVSPNNKKAHFKVGYIINDFDVVGRIGIEPITY